MHLVKNFERAESAQPLQALLKPQVQLLHMRRRSAFQFKGKKSLLWAYCGCSFTKTNQRTSFLKVTFAFIYTSPKDGYWLVVKYTLQDMYLGHI